MHPVEVLGDGPGLVALDAADEVPFDGLVFELLDLLQGLLQIALAEALLSRRHRLPYFLGAAGLAHREQLHGAGVAAVTRRRGFDALAYGA